MKSLKIHAFIAAALLGLSQTTEAFTTSLSFDIASPIYNSDGTSGVYNIRIGTYQGISSLSSDALTAYNQLAAGFNTVYTASGVASDAMPSYSALSVVSPYSAAGGFDNSIFWFLTNTDGDRFALFKGTDTWNDGNPIPVQATGLGWDSVTAVFGSIDTGGEALRLSATAVPEPTSGSLFLLGAAGVLALRRLRKNNV